MTRLVATCAVAVGNRLGEGIVWNRRDQSLYWTDITAATLWKYCIASGKTETWTMPEPLASFALCENDDWLLLGLASRLAFLHRSTGRVVPLCEVEAGISTRINDGTCDREGRFVFGTKHEPANGELHTPVGGFYRLDPDLSLQRLALDGVAIANGIAFSPDGRTMYFCDSATRVIQRCTYTQDGTAQAVREWIDLRDMPGEPDGSTVDAEGGVWNAQWDMGRVVRYDPDGHIDTVVEVSARRPTRPALGGPNMDTLFITSARDENSPNVPIGHEYGGHVFATKVAVHGLPEPFFTGSPQEIPS